MVSCRRIETLHLSADPYTLSMVYSTKQQIIIMSGIALHKSRSLIVLWTMICIGLLSGCSTTGDPGKDPFERYNRGMTSFNQAVDESVLAPVARGYRAVVPSPARNGIKNFFLNLREPLNIIYDVLQGKFRMAGRSTGRFLVNTTLGFAGLNDVASYMDLPRRGEDFGQVLAVWGVPSGPHLVLPFLGASNVRDTFGLVPNYAYRSALSLGSPEDTISAIVEIVDIRSRLLGTEDLLNLQPDRYLFLRETYRQRRQAQINDQSLSQQGPSDDELLDELFEEN